MWVISLLRQDLSFVAVVKDAWRVKSARYIKAFFIHQLCTILITVSTLPKYSKTCLKRLLKKKTKNSFFKPDYHLMQVKSIAAFCNTFNLH